MRSTRKIREARDDKETGSRYVFRDIYVRAIINLRNRDDEENHF